MSTVSAGTKGEPLETCVLKMGLQGAHPLSPCAKHTCPLKASCKAAFANELKLTSDTNNYVYWYHLGVLFCPIDLRLQDARRFLPNSDPAAPAFTELAVWGTFNVEGALLSFHEGLDKAPGLPTPTDFAEHR